MLRLDVVYTACLCLSVHLGFGEEIASYMDDVMYAGNASSSVREVGSLVYGGKPKSTVGKGAGRVLVEGIWARNPTMSRLERMKVTNSSMLVEQNDEWYVRTKLGLDKLVQRSFVCLLAKMLTVRGHSFNWYSFNGSLIPAAAKQAIRKLPVLFSYDSKTILFNGSAWFIYTKELGRSIIVSYSYETNKPMQVKTEDGRWHKVPVRSTKAYEFVQYLARLPIEACSRRVIRTDNCRLRKFFDKEDNTTKYQVLGYDNRTCAFVGHGDSVFYAASKGKWYVFKDPPIQFKVFASGLTYKKRGCGHTLDYEL